MTNKSWQVLQLTPGVSRKPTRSIRFAPFWEGKILASFWRIWAQGAEVYVANRNAAGTAKLSLHSKGKWTFNAGTMRKELGPAMTFLGSEWRSAVRLAFYTDEDTRPMREVTNFKTSTPVTLFATPPGQMLVAAVLFGSKHATLETPLPAEFPGEIIMRTQLRNGPPVVVVAATIPISVGDHKYIAEARGRCGKWADSSAPDNVEYWEVRASPNMVCIFPLRKTDWIEPSEPAVSGASLVTAAVTGADKSKEILCLMVAGKD